MNAAPAVFAMAVPLTERVTIWADPRWVQVIAAVAVAMLVLTIVLFRRRRRSGNGPAIVCLLLSLSLHSLLLVYVPQLTNFRLGGGPDADDATRSGGETVAVAMFDPLPSDSVTGEEAGDSPAQTLAPLPLASFTEKLLDAPEATAPPSPSDAKPPEAPARAPTLPPETLVRFDSPAEDTPTTELDASLGDWLREATSPKAETRSPSPPTETLAAEAAASLASHAPRPETSSGASASFSDIESKTAAATMSAAVDADFTTRQGAAKLAALLQNGGDAQTEAAVTAALRFLVGSQRADGAWDPTTTGAGLERAPLGLQRNNAGRTAESALTGLALLSLLGAGHTHQSGEYQEPVYRALVYLLSQQRADGSLAGRAAVYEAHYSHAMATLALAEAAAMTQDPSALEATRRAIAYTGAMQHPSTGGWRYTRGDPGDLSQLGWHVMSIDAAVRAGALSPPTETLLGARRFLDSVKAGSEGGQACYRPGERPTPTMTAEALASRLMIGDRPPDAAIAEAERKILQNLPPRGNMAAVDNYYFWYYATLALHQLQDDAWRVWNPAMKERLLATQSTDGSWPATTLWGGYGGTVYTTSMATLCLESYYRHQVRPPR